MSLPLLALVGLVALTGPLLAGAARWRMPVVIGELLAGIAIGGSGLRLVNASDPTFTFLGEVGFAVTMFVAGTHVPVRDARLRPALLAGVLRAAAVGVLSAGAGFGIAALFGTGHGGVYAVIMASSSAALVLPAVDQLGLGGDQLLPTLAQVAVADTACIVALPLAMDWQNAPRAGLGAALIALLAVAIALALRWADETDRWDRLRDTSKEHHLALELRISLVVLFGLAAVAAVMHVSVLLAGFALGLAVSFAGEPHRLAKQLFAVAEGFLAPLYFVWLGASLSVAALVADPHLVLLGLTLGIAAVLTHLALAVSRQHPLWAVSTSAQLGVPVAAATIGTSTGLLAPGEPAALVLGALVTIAALTLATAMASRRPEFQARSAGEAHAGVRPAQAAPRHGEPSPE
ncbi:MAG TPA: cation:proton antiporter [Propionibacteriaceae bacterium]|nr:cation:proton antiporter [Propionibacteriaceae bacterium]